MVHTSLLAPPETDLVAYAVQSIAACSGPQLPGPDPSKVIQEFQGRFGRENAMAICQHIFGPCKGVWRSAPVTVARFTKSNDEFFAIPVLRELGIIL